MVAFWTPRFCSWAVRVATAMASILARSSGLSRERSGCGALATQWPFSSTADDDGAAACGARPAASREPQASSRCTSSTCGCAPNGARECSESTTVVTRRPVVGAPGALGASTSTSTTSPGWATEDPAGVPVRMTSPSSSVMSCERSATSWPNGNTRPSVVSSWTISPLTQVRTRRAAGSRPAAEITAGPSGV